MEWVEGLKPSIKVLYRIKADFRFDLAVKLAIKQRPLFFPKLQDYCYWQWQVATTATLVARMKVLIFIGFWVVEDSVLT